MSKDSLGSLCQGQVHTYTCSIRLEIPAHYSKFRLTELLSPSTEPYVVRSLEEIDYADMVLNKYLSVLSQEVLQLTVLYKMTES